MTTIHTRKLQQYTRQPSTIHTRQLSTIHTRHLKIQQVEIVNYTRARDYCIKFVVFIPSHILLTLSPQPFTSHHLTTHINFSHKVSFLPPSLHCTSLHFTSFHFTSCHFTTLLYDFHFILFRFSTLFNDFQHNLSSFNSSRLSLSLHSF